MLLSDLIYPVFLVFISDRQNFVCVFVCVGVYLATQLSKQLKCSDLASNCFLHLNILSYFQQYAILVR